jgi:hypothetical protein
MEALSSPLLASILRLANRQLHGRISVGSEQTLLFLLRQHDGGMAFLDDLRTFNSVWVWTIDLYVEAVGLVAVPALPTSFLRVGPQVFWT